MMKYVVVAAMGMLFSLEVRAQVTLDLAKVTCDQYVGYKITDPQNIAIWLSGYFNGKRSNTIIDTQGFNANAKKLQDFCFRNPATPVMQAVEEVFDMKRDDIKHDRAGPGTSNRSLEPAR
jgi:acid stress chaperone HdeB